MTALDKLVAVVRVQADWRTTVLLVASCPSINSSVGQVVQDMSALAAQEQFVAYLKNQRVAHLLLHS